MNPYETVSAEDVPDQLKSESILKNWKRNQ